MPNVPSETGLTDKLHERIRLVMCEINFQRAAIHEAERKLRKASGELMSILFPRTDRKENDTSEMAIPHVDTEVLRHSR